MDDIKKLRELADRFFRPLVCNTEGRHTDWRCDIVSLRGFAIALAAARLAELTQPAETKDDPAALWDEIHRLRAAVQGPDGYGTWQEAATAERVRRVAAERKVKELTRAAHGITDGKGGSMNQTIVQWAEEHHKHSKCKDINAAERRNQERVMWWLLLCAAMKESSNAN